MCKETSLALASQIGRAGKVRRYHVELFANEGKQIAEHMACGRKTVQEKQLRRADIPRFAIENPDAANFDCLVSDRAHQMLLLFALDSGKRIDKGRSAPCLRSDSEA